MRRTAVKILQTAIAIYVLLCALLFIFQRSLLYLPQPRTETQDSVLLTLPVGSTHANVSTVPHDGPTAVIYFGGNAEDVSRDVPDLKKAFPETAIYALHYPGYGGTPGKPTQQGIFAAAQALYDRVQADHTKIIVIGRSLGSGVAVWIASQKPVARLVLITPFDSLGDAAAHVYPWLPVRLLLRDRYNSGSYAPSVTAPTHIIVASDDQLVPRSSSDRLRTRFHEGLVTYTVLAGYDHNNVQDSPSYWSLISKE